MPYSAEVLPAVVVRDMLSANWNTQDGNIPTPVFFIVGDTVNPQIRQDLNRGDVILLSADTPAETENPIGVWLYGNRLTRVLLELDTRSSRQRLYDLKQEVRRICHSQMHSLSNYQRVQFVSFNELTETFTNIWSGRAIIELVNNAVLLET